jgi:hypothetical protein
MFQMGGVLMTKMHLLSKLALTVLGVLVLVESLRYIRLVGTVGPGLVPSLCSLGIFLLLSVLACRLLFWCDAWVERMIGPADQDAPPVSRIRAVGGFRVVLLFCGLLVLADRIEILIRAVAFITVAPRIIVNMIVYRHIDKVFYMPVSSWARLIADLCGAALGIYLVLGAPRFVRWQMSKFYAPTPAYKESQRSMA